MTWPVSPTLPGSGQGGIPTALEDVVAPRVCHGTVGKQSQEKPRHFREFNPERHGTDCGKAPTGPAVTCLSSRDYS